MGMAMQQLSVRHYGAAMGSHSHDHFQVLVGLRGVLELEVDGRGQRVGAGEGLLVAPGDRHDFEAVQGSECLVLDTDVGLWSQCAPAPHCAAQVAPLAHFLAQALQRNQPLARLHGPSLLLEAWRPFVPPARANRRRIDWQALSVWAATQWHAPLTVAQLAQRVFLSPSQFALRCHEANGMAPQEWLRHQRLALARQLRAGGLPVHEVARRTGYRSPSALTAALRRTGR
ncbi:AraC family transcriptional regulator [Caenimonas sedimenti]|uniref:AraC family transcriptional regulator n=1 Tax=Caenimonas sedimenti TaxID=2596921 RepID=A0A562ZNN5_9BURK|nr:AraC family transcriptional regulator [Caenimonas sedimenti]TWO69764.1 AraC family transcriptional regulator [Caenimonas sedimenti]